MTSCTLNGSNATGSFNKLLHTFWPRARVFVTKSINFASKLVFAIAIGVFTLKTVFLTQTRVFTTVFTIVKANVFATDSRVFATVFSTESHVFAFYFHKSSTEATRSCDEEEHDQRQEMPRKP